MEDRHYLSEPRPIYDLEIPTWEVDVIREGVDDPVMTLIVDRNTLPPRKSKKKIVWKLPDDVNVLPKFGVQDKKRILDMYKEKKKEAKKSMRRASRLPSPSSADQFNDTEAANGISDTDQLDDKAANNNGKSSSMDRQQMPPDIITDNVKQKLSYVSSSSSPSPPPGLETLSLDTTPSITSEKPYKHSDPLNIHYVPPNHLPPGLHSGPPPGIHHAPNPPPGISSNSTSILSETSSSTFHSLPSDLPVEGRCFFHPSMAMSPLVQTPATLAAVANLVTESYYLLLYRGLINELASYYAMDAQKSLTVGGAYAACTSAGDRLLQLQSLAGTIKPIIKGIQQQPTLAGGVMVMVTGISVRPPAGMLLPFCHTLVLCPVSNSLAITSSIHQGQSQGIVGYQIQNDNLVFLTGDDAPTSTSNGGVVSETNGIESSS
jgi:hypothetical protein